MKADLTLTIEERDAIGAALQTLRGCHALALCLEQTRDEIVAELVKEHERPQCADERDQGQPERRLRKHQWQTAFIAE